MVLQCIARIDAPLWSLSSFYSALGAEFSQSIDPRFVHLTRFAVELCFVSDHSLTGWRCTATQSCCNGFCWALGSDRARFAAAVVAAAAAIDADTAAGIFFSLHLQHFRDFRTDCPCPVRSGHYMKYRRCRRPRFCGPSAASLLLLPPLFWWLSFLAMAPAVPLRPSSCSLFFIRRLCQPLKLASFLFRYDPRKSTWMAVRVAAATRKHPEIVCANGS